MAEVAVAEQVPWAPMDLVAKAVLAEQVQTAVFQDQQ
jgi:hypothetical protein